LALFTQFRGGNGDGNEAQEIFKWLKISVLSQLLTEAAEFGNRLALPSVLEAVESKASRSPLGPKPLEVNE
jgi:hypothetical protein